VQLAELGIRTVEDLLTYYPRRFDLRRQVQPMASLRGDEGSATVAGEVTDVEYRPFGRRPSFKCTLADDDGNWLTVRWFHGGYLRDKVRNGMTIAVSGKVSTYRGLVQFINPNLQIIYDPAGARLDVDELMPVYPAGARLTSAHIAQVVKEVLPEAERLIPRWFPPDYLACRGLMGRPQAVAAMHRPEDRDHWSAARRRLAYDECLLMQLGIALVRMRQVSRPAHPIRLGDKAAEVDRRIRARFGFDLTAAQDRVIAEIAADMAREHPMNRLLQGDVGSGKTVVALYAALLAVAAGKQTAIMAPTEILAAQHYGRINAYLSGSRVRTALLVGGQAPAERAPALAAMAAGEVDIVVGTHALLGEDVRFANLALVIVDEQHKFGVRQRSGIRGKGFAPHYLVMTATPIPRTLALTVFGDLDVSVIDQLPPGRGKTVTRCLSEKRLAEALAQVRSRLLAGQQAYLVYPLVNPSPQLELTAAQDAFRQLSAGPLAAFRVGLIHGQMPAAQKEQAMDQFRRRQIDALVASVIVEVGMDVPNANVLLVMHAERFGLAQLHQLRGRIGRSAQDALCILAASPNNPIAKRRLEIMEQTDDGFRIAEEDLRLRGPGEFFGTRQHGLPELKVADLIDDFELLRMARRDAGEILNEDPDLTAPHHQQLRKELIKAYQGRLELLSGA